MHENFDTYTAHTHKVWRVCDGGGDKNEKQFRREVPTLSGARRQTVGLLFLLEVQRP